MAKTANEELLDAIVRHQTYMLRYGGSVRNRMGQILNATEEELAMRIREKLAKSNGLSTPVEWQRLQALQSSLTAIRQKAWDQISTELQEELSNLAYKEPIFISNMVTAVCPVVVETVLPSARLLKSIVTSRPFEGRLLKDWASHMAREDVRRIRSAVQAGMLSGETSATIARRVVGSSTLKGMDGMTQISRRDLEAVVHTAVQHVANHSRNEFLMANADLFELEQFVATLDGRTTPVCRANDAKQFALGKGPRPPLHIRCRSLRVAVINGAFAGERPAKPVTEKMLLAEYGKKNGLGVVTTRDGLPRGTKGDYNKFARARTRELIGRVPATTSYDQWLRSQSQAFQNDTLGLAKAQLFRDGLSLDKFVAANGSELTLAQLAAKYPNM